MRNVIFFASKCRPIFAAVDLTAFRRLVTPMGRDRKQDKEREKEGRGGGGGEG